MRTIAPALAALFSFAAAGPALAQVSAEQAIQIAIENGMAEVEELDRDRDKWEVEGRDADDREMEIDINAQTGEVIEIDD